MHTLRPPTDSGCRPIDWAPCEQLYEPSEDARRRSYHRCPAHRPLPVRHALAGLPAAHRARPPLLRRGRSRARRDEHRAGDRRSDDEPPDGRARHAHRAVDDTRAVLRRHRHASACSCCRSRSRWASRSSPASACRRSSRPCAPSTPRWSTPGSSHRCSRSTRRRRRSSGSPAPWRSPSSPPRSAPSRASSCRWRSCCSAAAWFISSPEVGRVRIPRSKRRFGSVLQRPPVLLATVVGFLLIGSCAAIEAGRRRQLRRRGTRGRRRAGDLVARLARRRPRVRPRADRPVGDRAPHVHRVRRRHDLDVRARRPGGASRSR